MTKFTPERRDMMHAEYPTATDAAAFLDRINAMPGDQFATIRQLACWANRMRLTKTIATRAAINKAVTARKLGILDLTAPRPAFVEPAPDAPPLTPAEQAPIADAAIAAKHERARRMLARKVCPHSVAANARLPLREVFRLSAEMRRQ